MAGCDSGPKMAPVSGTVLLDGKPMVGASVNTQPIGTSENPGSGSFGKTDDQGHYSLELVNPPLPGAILGEHSVTITTKAPEEDFENDDDVVRVGPRLPARYSDGSERMTVTPGGITRDFDITLKE